MTFKLPTVHETVDRLRNIRNRARDRWSTDGGCAEVIDEQDGIEIRIVYEGSNRNTDYRSVFLDGHFFARASETLPWNVFKPLSIYYTVFLDLSLPTATKLLAEIDPVGYVELEDEWCPPANRPTRCFATCLELDDVIALWKVWKPKYLP